MSAVFDLSGRCVELTPTADQGSGPIARRSPTAGRWLTQRLGSPKAALRILESVRRSLSVLGVGPRVCTEKPNPGVAVMESAQYEKRCDARDPLNPARDRRIFVQYIDGYETSCFRCIPKLQGCGPTTGVSAMPAAIYLPVSTMDQKTANQKQG
jgi:hypothetical protein